MGFSVVNSVISLVISPYLFLSYDTAVHVEKNVGIRKKI